jgi:putative ABC transport system ATP-binding protein
MTDANPAVQLEGVGKRFGTGPQAVVALFDVNLLVRRGEFVTIMGPSGCGKSTLLNLIAGLDMPDEGRVVVGGQDLGTLSDDQRSDLRLNHIGFVFQGFHLLPTFTVEENVTWALQLQGQRARQARETARAMLERTGVAATALGRLPAELSGGEQQRVAIARALATRPLLVLADEPTGNLDSHTGVQILDLLRALNRSEGVTILMATHSLIAGAYGHRTIELYDGQVTREHVSPSDPDLRLVHGARRRTED